jgi:hypothetical protein
VLKIQGGWGTVFEIFGEIRKLSKESIEKALSFVFFRLKGKFCDRSI